MGKGNRNRINERVTGVKGDWERRWRENEKGVVYIVGVGVRGG
jgi:hypothetical protein